MMQKLRRLLAALAVLSALALLAGCGGSGVSQTVKTEHYSVQLSLDGTNFGEHTATIDVNDLAGKPVAADQVVISSLMQQMGMASPETTAQQIAPGRYQAKSELFSMAGEWRVDVRVSAGGSEETAQFTFPVAQ